MASSMEAVGVVIVSPGKISFRELRKVGLINFENRIQRFQDMTTHLRRSLSYQEVR